MRVEVLPFPEVVHDRALLRERSVAVVDVLRASSTIVTAIVNRCREVIPVEDASDAVRMTHTLDHALLCGERGGIIIKGFNLGNSPAEFESSVVEGRTLILSTTNGTKAIMKAREARDLLIGSLLNAQAIAEALAAMGDHAMILCAGTLGRFSLDDILCAGAIIDRLSALRKIDDIDDLSVAALSLYRSARGDLAGTLLNTTHAQHLVAIGCRDDVLYCAQQDIYDVVPVFRDGMIKAGRK